MFFLMKKNWPIWFFFSGPDCFAQSWHQCPWRFLHRHLMWQTDHAWRRFHRLLPFCSLSTSASFHGKSSGQLPRYEKVPCTYDEDDEAILDLFGRHHCMIFCLLLSGSAELLGSAPVMTWSNCTLDITGHDGTGMIKTLKRSLSDLSQRSAF